MQYYGDIVRQNNQLTKVNPMKQVELPSDTYKQVNTQSRKLIVALSLLVFSPCRSHSCLH